jgi:hypothetical protein
MHNDVSYKIISGACLLSLCVTLPMVVSAENAQYWDAPKYTVPSIDHSYNSEADNPWHQSEPRSHAPGPWSLPAEQNQPYENQRERYSGNQLPYYEPQYDSRRYVRPDATSQFQQAPAHQTWQQPRQADASQDRYVTPEIIDQLNHQEAQHYARLRGERERQFVPSPHLPSYGGGSAQGYSAPPAYGMGSINPAYDVPAVSPWGETPDVLNRGEQFPWMPNEAVGGVPPIHVSPYANKNQSHGVDESANNTEKKVFNPYTFLQD